MSIDDNNYFEAPLLFRNDSGQDVPAFSVMRVTGSIRINSETQAPVDSDEQDLENPVSGSPCLTVTKPGENPEDAGNAYVISLDHSVPIGGYGYATAMTGVYARYKEEAAPDDGVPAAGEEWGPKSGSWALSKKGTGWRILGGVEADRKIVRVAPTTAESATVLLVTINSAVAATDTTFQVEDVYYEVIFGAEERQFITVKNTFGEDFLPTAKVIAFRRSEDKEYEVDRGGAGTPVIHYELTENMALADTAKLAKPVTVGGVLDSLADPFYVLDPQRQYVGKAAFTDALGVQTGYRGYAVRTIDDYNSTGMPGYRIVSQEGPLRWLAVTLATDYNPAQLPLLATPASLTVYGNPFSGRRPSAESGTGALSIHDPRGVGEGGKAGDKWWAIYNESLDRYELFLGDNASSLKIGGADVYLGVDGVGQVNVPGEPAIANAVNRTNRPIFQNSQVVVDFKSKAIIASNMPTLCVAVAQADGANDASAGSYAQWAGLSFFQSSVSDSVVATAPVEVQDPLELLQFVRSGDKVVFTIHGSGVGNVAPCILTAVAIDLPGRDFEKLTWVCGLPTASPSEEPTKVLGKPSSPGEGPLCNPQWFDLPPAASPEDIPTDQHINTLINNAITAWVATIPVSSYVASNTSLVLSLTATTLTVTLNYVLKNGKIIDSVAAAAPPISGSVAVEEACPNDP